MRPAHRGGLFGFGRHRFDADEFFVNLARELGCFPPQFIQEPFTCLEKRIEWLELSLPEREGSPDHLQRAKDMIQEAKKIEEKYNQQLAAKLRRLTLAGKYEEAIELGKKQHTSSDAEAATWFAWAYIIQGNRLEVQAAGMRPGAEADDLFQQACQKCEAALKIKPDMHAALNNLGQCAVRVGQNQIGRRGRDIACRSGEKLCRARGRAARLRRL